MPTLIKNPQVFSLPGTVFYAETRGGKYALRVALLENFCGGRHAFAVTGWTSGLLRGTTTRFDYPEARELGLSRVADAAKYDGINYDIHWNLEADRVAEMVRALPACI